MATTKKLYMKPATVRKLRDEARKALDSWAVLHVTILARTLPEKYAAEALAASRKRGLPAGVREERKNLLTYWNNVVSYPLAERVNELYELDMLGADDLLGTSNDSTDVRDDMAIAIEAAVWTLTRTAGK